MSTASEIAGEAYGQFEQAKRQGSDETFTRLKDDAPEWLSELVRAAHGNDFLPDDYRYEWTQDALGAIHDAGLDDLDDHNAVMEASDEFADGVDVYTHDLNRWYSSNLTRAAYCDEAVNSGLVEPDADITRRITLGQYMERREVFELVVSSLRDHIDGLDQ